MNVHDVVREVLALEDQIIDNGGELTPALEAYYAAMEGVLEAKVERIVKTIRWATMLAGDAEEEIERLQRLVRSRKSIADGLKGVLDEVLRSSGRPRLDAGTCVVYRQANPPSVEVAEDVDIAEFPEEWLRFKPAVIEVDRKALVAAAKAGAVLPAGVHLLPQSHHVRIR